MLDEDTEQPWFRKLEESPPLRLSKRITSNATNNDAPNFRTLAPFPWDKSSLETLWNGGRNDPESAQVWSTTIAKYWDAVAVGAGSQAYIFFTHSKRKPMVFDLPDFDQKLIDADKTHVAWAIERSTIHLPLLIISRGSLLYIYGLEQGGMTSYLRGHGGAITSIAVHPLAPEFFATTSRDFSTRIYNLTFPPVAKPNNPHWPPAPKGQPSLAGPAHGLHLNIQEGSGLGRCIIVLMGGRSGGHNAAVLGAAFHPTFPLIATCGMDRAVKIWLVRTDSDGVQLIREDKPLFSSPRLHKARVTSVSWLTAELLVSHSAPAIMRKDFNDPTNRETYLEPGQLVVWRWLALNRFFNPQFYEVRQATLRGCQSDYQDSSSFKFVAAYSYPNAPTQYITPSTTLFQSPWHDPLVLWTVPSDKHFHITNLALLKPRNMPSFNEAFPFADEIETEGTAGLAAVTEHLYIDTGPEPEAGESGALPAVPEEGAEAKKKSRPPIMTTSVRLDFAPFVPSPLQDMSWRVELPPDDKGELNCVAMTCGGRLIIGVGTNGSIWVWEVCDRR
ncbi:WD40-repeat-containing domain protein [Coprinopsis sp. MPI-PUGE-AT-0042]|nr:WD40-repeat-containing domain protein [Coprinopsis sp. MPI-PUGE-AT-0042]